MFEKTAISVSQTVDKTEDANNNEIKILLLPPDSQKSQKTVFSENLVHKYSRKCETLATFRYFQWPKKIFISSGKSNDVKILIWSMSWVLGC